jgi:hypothetical protein
MLLVDHYHALARYNDKGFFRRPAARMRRDETGWAAAGWRKGPVELNR